MISLLNEDQWKCTLKKGLLACHAFHFKLLPRLGCPNKNNNLSFLQRLLAQIRSAKKSLDICVFLITSHHLAEEVINRIKKGVTVRIILDDSSGTFLPGMSRNLLELK